jgi:hypothetical protein
MMTRGLHDAFRVDCVKGASHIRDTRAAFGLLTDLCYCFIICNQPWLGEAVTACLWWTDSIETLETPV